MVTYAAWLNSLNSLPALNMEDVLALCPVVLPDIKTNSGAVPEDPSVLQNVQLEDPGVLQNVRPEDPGVCQNVRPEDPGVCQNAQPEDPSVLQNVQPKDPGVCQNVQPEDPSMLQNVQPKDPGVLQNVQPKDPNVCQNAQPEDPGVLQNLQPKDPGVCQNVQPEDPSMLQNVQPKDPGVLQNVQPEDPGVLQNLQPKDPSVCQNVQPEDPSMLQNVQPKDPGVLQNVQPEDPGVLQNAGAFSSTSLVLPAVRTRRRAAPEDRVWETVHPAGSVLWNTADPVDPVVWKTSDPEDPADAFSSTNQKMLESGDLSDVTFLVGVDKKEIHAHQNILASRSPEFFTMFCGSLNQPEPFDPCEVEITDTEYDIMKQLIRFIYTMDCQVSGDTVLYLMHAAKEYAVPALMDHCHLFLQSNLTPDNVCIVLQQAYKLGELELVNQCMFVIYENAKAALGSDAFLCLDKWILETILKAEFLVEEEFVYRACLRWAGKACTAQGKPINDKERRNILGDLLYLIRFPCMPPMTFTAKVSKGNVLTEEEKVSIFRYFFEKKKENCKFVTKPRVHYVSQIIMKRFRKHRYMLVEGSSSHDEIQFKCSESVKLTAVGLFLPLATTNFSALLEISGHGFVIGTKAIGPQQANNKITGQGQVISTNEIGPSYIVLDAVIPIQKDIQFGLALSVTYSEPNQQVPYGVQGHEVAKCGNLSVTFSDKDGRASDFTNVLKGQFQCLVLEFY